MKKLTFVRFNGDISMGNYDRDRWTDRMSETDGLMKTIDMVELDDGDIQMTWTGGKDPVVDVIPRHNVKQIRRAIVVVAPVQGAKK